MIVFILIYKIKMLIKQTLFLFCFFTSTHAMELVKKESLYFSLLPLDVRNIVHSFLKKPRCKHKNIQQHFASEVDKKVKIEKNMDSGKKKKLTNVTSLLLLGANPNAENVLKSYPLITAIRNEDLEMVQLLLRTGADPNAEDTSTNWRPIHYATRYKQERIAQALIRAGAQLNFACDTEEDLSSHPLYLATYSNSLQMMEVLYSYGISTSRSLWKKCLKEANCWSLFELIPFITAQSKSDCTGSKCSYSALLTNAAKENNIDAVRTLLKVEANPNTGTGEFRPITYAALNNNLNMVQLFLEHGAKVKQIKGRWEYDDPLVVAIEKDNVKMVRLILMHRKKVDSKDPWAPRPLAVAWQNPKTHPQIIGMLRKAGAKLGN